MTDCAWMSWYESLLLFLVLLLAAPFASSWVLLRMLLVSSHFKNVALNQWVIYLAICKRVAYLNWSGVTMLGRQKARGLFRGIQLDHKGFGVVFRFTLFSKDHLVWKINWSDWKTCHWPINLSLSQKWHKGRCVWVPLRATDFSELSLG